MYCPALAVITQGYHGGDSEGNCGRGWAEGGGSRRGGGGGDEIMRNR